MWIKKGSGTKAGHSPISNGTYLFNMYKKLKETIN